MDETYTQLSDADLLAIYDYRAGCLRLATHLVSVRAGCTSDNQYYTYLITTPDGEDTYARVTKTVRVTAEPKMEWKPAEVASWNMHMTVREAEKYKAAFEVAIALAQALDEVFPPGSDAMAGQPVARLGFVMDPEYLKQRA